MPDEDDAPKPWEQQAGEYARAFAAFVRFRDLPADRRSVFAAWESTVGEEAARKRQGRRAPTQWYDWCREQGWVARAAAWDLEQDRLAREQAQKDLLASRRRRLGQARWLQSDALRRLRAMAEKGEDIPAAVVLQMVKLGQDSERLELGEATARTEAEVSAVAPEAVASRQAQVEELLRTLFPGAEGADGVETGAPVDDG